VPPYITEERSRRSQSRGSLGGQRTDSRYDSRHEFRIDPRGIDSRHRDIDRPGPNVPLLHDPEILPDRDVGYFRGSGGMDRGIGYDRVHIDHVDLSRPPPPLPFRGGPFPPELDRLQTRGSSDRLDEYHRDVDRHGGHHGLLRPPNWERMDRSSRDEWEARYSHEQTDRRGVKEEFREGLLPLPPAAIQAVRGDGPRVKQEEPPVAENTSETVEPVSGSIHHYLASQTVIVVVDLERLLCVCVFSGISDVRNS